MTETVLITGITGFVGSHMADFILAEKPGIRVVGTKRWHLSRLDNIEHLVGRVELAQRRVHHQYRHPRAY